MPDKFTIEEIMLIKSCHTKDKDKAILILKSYLKDVGSEMAETIRNTIEKLQKLSQEDFLEAVNYPI